MSDFLSKISPGDVVPIVMFALMAVCAIVITIAALWYAARKAEILANLKQDMLNRGMSAEEIKIVLEAGHKH